MAETSTSNERVSHQADTDGIDVMEGEWVLANRRPGWAMWWKAIAVGAFFLLASLSAGAEGVVGGLFIAGPIFAYVVVARSKSRYIVTTERVKAGVGLISQTTREYRIPDIQSITTEQGIFEKIFGYGSIRIRTAANDRITWKNVPDYDQVANYIREEQRKYDEARSR